MEKVIKIVLAILFFLCLLDMPYSYFETVRFVAMVAFGYLAYVEHKQENQGLMVAYIVLALLFQPFFKIALGRSLWNVVDVVVAVGLVASIFYKLKSEKTD
ncbi:hypothetical protein F0365_07980 [Nonlabens sp. Ci31]|uniref:DUF6804 family protein n=1 Tax=Nonlabens sp. Ci31 TaxID=2608253 RepID=UPI00146358CC|nr:DUF6804 family protein [Nonlabens sp. Ci31]QJP34339.1 hypothetical protein F0365_07980 [Nonlabens sp. Ci31]